MDCVEKKLLCKWASAWPPNGQRDTDDILPANTSVVDLLIPRPELIKGFWECENFKEKFLNQ